MARIPRVRRSALTEQSRLRPEAGNAWGALAVLSATVEGIVRPKAIQDAKEQGANAVYRDDTGALKVDEASLLGGELAAAHNGAAFAAYLGQSRLDTRETLTELRRKHLYDPAGFKEAADAYVKNAVADAPPALRTDIKASAGGEAVAIFDGLRHGQIGRDNKKADKASLAARAALAEDVVSLIQGGASFDDPRVVAKMGEIGEITAFRTNSAYIGETEAEAEALVKSIRGTAKAARFMREIEEIGGVDSLSPEDRERLTAAVLDEDIDPATREKMHRVLNGELKSLDARSFVRGITSDRYEDRVRMITGETDLKPYLVGGGLRPDAITGLTPGFRSSISRMIAAAPPEIQKVLRITSAYRSPAVQKVLWEKALKKYGSASAARKWVAPPGKSHHNRGEAVDFKYLDPKAKKWVHENAEAFGLHFPLGNEPWHAEPMGSRGGSPIPSKLAEAGIPASPGNRAILEMFGATAGVDLLKADPTASAEEILGEDAAAARPDLVKGKTVADVIRKVQRHMHGPKSSDIAAMRDEVEAIPDAETRAMAHRGLNTWYAMERQDEAEAAEAYSRRMAEGDTITRDEVLGDNDLDDAGQALILNALKKQNDAARDVIETIADINDPNRYVDPNSVKDRNRVDRAFRAAAPGDPLSPEGQAAAAQIIANTGFAPKSFYGAINGALRSADPERIATAMSVAEQVMRQHPGAFAPYGRGGKALNQDIAEYRHEIRTGSTAAEAAIRMAERRTPDAIEKRKTRAGEAKKFAKEMSAEDLLESMNDQWPIIGLGQTDPWFADAERDKAMALLRREAEEQFIEIGDKEAAKARAIAEVARVYAPTNVAGSSGMIMRFPPERTYPTVNGNHEWLSKQLVADVSKEAGEDIPKERIFLHADDETLADITAGRPASYTYYYADEKDEIHLGKGRFFGDTAAAQAEFKAEISGEYETFARKRAEREAFFDDVRSTLGESSLESALDRVAEADAEADAEKRAADRSALEEVQKRIEEEGILEDITKAPVATIRGPDLTKLTGEQLVQLSQDEAAVARGNEIWEKVSDDPQILAKWTRSMSENGYVDVPGAGRVTSDEIAAALALRENNAIDPEFPFARIIAITAALKATIAESDQ